jgi:hypothetical protein
MKYLLLFALIFPNCIAAQEVKTRTQYASHAVTDSTANKIIEEILYYTFNGELLKEEVYSNGSLESVEVYTYNTNKALQTTIHYDVIASTKQLDSASAIRSDYTYMPNNVVKKSTIQSGTENSTSTFVTDANGRKISDNYIYTLDAKNRLQERYRKNNDKKTARIEKFYYLQNNKLQALKIFLGKKPLSVTTYFYNADNQLAKEVTKNIKGKKSTTDSIYYQYTNELLQKEISVNHGQEDTVVEYSYTFY